MIVMTKKYVSDNVHTEGGGSFDVLISNSHEYSEKKFPEATGSISSWKLGISHYTRLSVTDMTPSEDMRVRFSFPDRSVIILCFNLEGPMEWYCGNEDFVSVLKPFECCIQFGIEKEGHVYFQRDTRHRHVCVYLHDRNYPFLRSALEHSGLRPDELPVESMQKYATSPGIQKTLTGIFSPPCSEAYRACYLEGKVLELISLFCGDILEKNNVAANISMDERACIQRAKEIIDEQYARPLTIKSLAKSCFISETRLKSGFKELFGSTVYEYLVDKRMEVAFDLLSSNQYNVQDVCWRVGYANVSHFSRQFRKKYGFNPGKIKSSD